MQFQVAVLWTVRGYDRRGQATVTDVAKEISVRWNTKRREVVQPNGNTIAYDASAVTHCPVAVGSIMWLGSLDQLLVGLEGQTIPQSSVRDQLFEVKACNVTPDIKGRESLTEVMLMRYKGVLPAISERVQHQ